MRESRGLVLGRRPGLAPRHRSSADSRRLCWSGRGAEGKATQGSKSHHHGLGSASGNEPLGKRTPMPHSRVSPQGIMAASWGCLADRMHLVAGALELSRQQRPAPTPCFPLVLRGPIRPPTLQVPLCGTIPCEKHSFIQ